ncbi:hypothetical protein CW749_20245 [Vibrio sp. vnigr-6D03]|nr:hypothetical protein CW749_20245 [Vibrio sp. vnigr-6D03]
MQKKPTNQAMNRMQKTFCDYKSLPTSGIVHTATMCHIFGMHAVSVLNAFLPDFYQKPQQLYGEVLNKV